MRLHQDKRGAVMLVAVFMAVFLVGALWYLVGLGDAMIYRERVQEGADAVAFSSAVVHARGMNVIAMMNLIMAAVMAVLVALKLAQMILAIIAGIAAIIAAASLGTCAPCEAVMAACAQGIAQIQQIINQVKQPIFNTLKALSTAEKGVAAVTPWLAEGEGVFLGSKYGKPIQLGLTASPSMIPRSGSVKTYGLPVEDGNYAKLCGKAGQDVGEFVFVPIELVLGGQSGAVEGFASGVGNMIGGLTESVSAFFCEGGSTSSATSAAGNAQRDLLAKQQCTAQAAAYARYQNQGGPNSGFNSKYVTLGTFHEDLCEADLKQQYDNQLQQTPIANDSGSGSDVQSRTPKKVSVGSSNEVVQNGSSHFQVYGFVLGDTSGLHYAPKLVEIAGWGKTTVSDPAANVQFAVAMAEFFYDCKGAWTDSACDADEEAMWNMNWRARLRAVQIGGSSAGGVGSVLGEIPGWLSGGGLSGGPSVSVNGADVTALTSAWSGGGAGLQGAFQQWMQGATQNNGLIPGTQGADPGPLQRLGGLSSVVSH